MSLIEQEMEDNITSDEEDSDAPEATGIRPDDIFYEPADARGRLFDALHEVAHQWATKPGDFTVEERCHGSVYGVMKVLGGDVGNRIDGDGLPNYQISVAASDDYNNARAEKGWPQYDQFTMLDWAQSGGSVGEDRFVNLADEYAKHYDQTRNDLARSAARLFD